MVYSLTYTDAKAYLMAGLFVVGNIALPQLCHMVPQGGFIFLPIYFFTLIAAYRYGFFVGLLTALLSPLVNHVLFGMPPAAVLPILLIKSSLLALAASYLAHRVGRVSILAIIGAVVAYQGLGMIAEGLMTSSLTAALQDVRLGWPGILLQVVLGFGLLKALDKKQC